jgi:HAD domain in Swiss Army Knife RNA repair proteins
VAAARCHLGVSAGPSSVGKSMKVIFLDIDGVLNSCKTVERWRGLVGIDASLARRFAGLQQSTGAITVLSSTWRLSRTWKSTMRKNGVVGIIDRTPDLPGRSRGEEIAAWLAAHPEVEVYAILDDDSDMLPHQPHFKTSFSRGGLTEKIAQQAQHHLLKTEKGRV